MRRVNQLAGIVFVALSLFVVIEAQRLTYYTPLGPGPGFFPFWLGSVLAVLSLLYLVQVSMRDSPAIENGFIPDGSGALRILSILVALTLFIVLAGILGFGLTAFLFLLFLLLALGRHHPAITFAISLAGSFGVYFAFLRWLGVQLPTSSIDLLRNLGL